VTLRPSPGRSLGPGVLAAYRAGVAVAGLILGVIGTAAGVAGFFVAVRALRLSQRLDVDVQLGGRSQAAADRGLSVGLTLVLTNTGAAALPPLEVAAVIAGEVVSADRTAALPPGQRADARLYLPIPEYAVFDTTHGRITSFPRGKPRLRLRGGGFSRMMDLPT